MASTPGENREEEGRRRIAELDKQHAEYGECVNQPRLVDCLCTTQGRLALATSSSGKNLYGDSYLAIVKGDSVLTMVREATVISNFWLGGDPCVRLRNFIDFADKRYDIISSLTKCSFRRLFLIIRSKVIKFCADIELAEKYGWHLYTKARQPFCRCPRRHTFTGILPRLRAVRAKYEQVPPLAQRLLQLLGKHVCDDVAQQVVSLYYNGLLRVC